MPKRPTALWLKYRRAFLVVDEVGADFCQSRVLQTLFTKCTFFTEFAEVFR